MSKWIARCRTDLGRDAMIVVVIDHRESTTRREGVMVSGILQSRTGIQGHSERRRVKRRRHDPPQRPVRRKATHLKRRGKT